MPDTPHRRLRLTLHAEADDVDTMAEVLMQIAAHLENDGREDRQVVSGGYAAGYDLTMTCDPEMDGDTYRELLTQWHRQIRRERAEVPDAG
jgi:hypothetical protein